MADKGDLEVENLNNRSDFGQGKNRLSARFIAGPTKDLISAFTIVNGVVFEKGQKYLFLLKRAAGGTCQ